MANRIVDDWVDVPEVDDWVDVPDAPTFAGGGGGEFGGQGATGTWEPETSYDKLMDFESKLRGAGARGTMTVGRAVLGAPATAVKQAGLVRQWGWAEEVLNEQDPTRQTELIGKMAESQKAFDSVADWLDKPKEFHEKGVKVILDNHPEWEADPPESFIDLLKSPDKLAVSVAEAIPLLAGAGIVMAAGQPQVAVALMYVTEGQNMADQTIADGGSEEEAAIAYGVYGSVAAALEMMQLQGIIKVAKGSYNALLNRTVQKVAKGGLRTAVMGTIKVAAQEALEEMTQGAWQEITAKMVYDKDIPGGVVDFIDRRAQEAYIGFTMGLIPGVGGGVAGRVAAPVVETPTEAPVEAPVVPPGSNVYQTEEGRIVVETPSDIGDKVSQKTELRDGLVVDKETGETLTQVEKGTVSGIQDAPKSEAEIWVPKGDKVNVKISGETANIYGIYADEKGTGLYKRTIEDLRSKGVKTVIVGSQSGDSQAVLKGLVEKGILTNPRGAILGSGNQYYDTTFDIAPTKAPPVTEAKPVVGSPITKQEKDALREQGYSVPDILKMKPTEARGLLGIEETTPIPEPTEVKPPAPKKLTPRQAQILGHSLPKKLGWTEAQRRDFMVETVGKPNMKGMTPKEARTLVAAMQEQARDQGVLPSEDYPKTIFIGGREVDTAEFINESVATVNNLKDRAAKQPNMRPRKQAKPGRKIYHIVKAAITGIDNLSIPHLMRQIGAAAEGVFKEVGVTNWRRSQHHIAATFRGGVDMLNDALDKAGVTHKDLARMSSAADPRLELLKRGREVIGRGKTKHYTVNINNKQFSLSMDELMDMYLASLQDKGPGHIETGGFEVRGYKTGPIDEAKMDELRAIVEADEGAMAAMNAAIKIADEYNAPQLNYTNGRLNPETMEDIADRTNYWHLEPKQPKKIKGKQTYNISLLENKNILKPRTGGKQPLVIRGFFPRFFTVQYAVSEYVGMAEELRLMNMILNNDAIIEGLEAKGYTEVRDNLKQLLEWVQNRSSTTTSTDKLLGKILHGAYRAVLHYSPEVIMSQYMSTGHYAGVVDLKYTPLLATPPTPKLVKEMLEHNPVVWQRYYAGGQSAELAELGQLDVTLRLLSGKHADLNKTGIAAQQTDLAAFAQGWKIAKAITKDTGVEEGTPEFWDAVNDQAEQLWDTQPSWDKWNKSINTSQRGVKKALFLFRSYYEKSLMMLHSANATYEQSDKTAKDRAKQAQVYGAVLGSQVATALMRTFIGWAIWRKRKDVWDYIAAAVAAPIGMMSLVGGYMGRVVGNMIRILGGSKQKFEGDPLSTLPGKTIEDFLLGLGQMGDASAHYLAGDEDKAEDQAKKATRKLIISVGTMRGVPVRQIDKIIKAMEQEEISGGYIP